MALQNGQEIYALKCTQYTFIGIVSIYVVSRWVKTQHSPFVSNTEQKMWYFQSLSCHHQPVFVWHQLDNLDKTSINITITTNCGTIPCRINYTILVLLILSLIPTYFHQPCYFSPYDQDAFKIQQQGFTCLLVTMIHQYLVETRRKMKLICVCVCVCVSKGMTFLTASLSFYLKGSHLSDIQYSDGASFNHATFTIF